MAENEPEKDSPEEITPRRGAIELQQVGSVLLIPVAAWLLLADRPWLAVAVFALVIVLFLRPFYLVKAEVEEAEAEKLRIEAEKKEKARVEAVEMAKTEAEKAAAALVEAKKPEPGMAMAPYHSSSEGIEVYHIFWDCSVGDNIEPENWRKGDGGKTLCKICEGMTRGNEKAA